MLRDWALSKLEVVKDSPRVLLVDPLWLLAEADSAIDSFATQNGFTVVKAATNLAFRQLYELAIAAKAQKLLVIDRAPARRRVHSSVTKAPPPFYPDLLAETPPEARIELNLRQFLIEKTGDPNWSHEVNDPLYARLIVRHLDGVLRAYQNLRTADAKRFTDDDFKKIVAYASLGVADSAFKQLNAEDYWTIGLLGHEALERLEELAPEVTKPIRAELEKAPKPFCWFASRDADLVIRAFYLSVILSQHTDNWNLLLANVDPTLSQLSGASVEILREAAPKLVAIDPIQADQDLEAVEVSLSRENLQFLLLDQIQLHQPDSFTTVVEKEQYSTLFRSLVLLMALDDLLSSQPSEDHHTRIEKILFPDNPSLAPSWIDTRPATIWSDLKKASQRSIDIQQLKETLAHTVKTLTVRKTEQLTLKFFWEAWNKKQLNRLEYYLSDLERLIYNAELLPRPEQELPSVFSNALGRIRDRIRQITKEVHQYLDEMNRRFQDLIATQYPNWLAKEGEVYLTSQFIRRCLKPYWDPQTEKAVVFVFDGMRYDIWDEFLKPMLESHMKLLHDFPAISILPSETHVSRWALAAGAEPQTYLTNRKAESVHLKSALYREFGYGGEVETVSPEGSGIGETVRYRAGNLEYVIFEFCDKELHDMKIKKLPDGREVPTRSLSFIYQQQLKNLIDTEVMAIVRSLTSGTKVFITADHGFGPVGRQPLWFDVADLNDPGDCSYLNCSLRVPLASANAPAKVRSNVVAFTPEQLGMPKTETYTKKSGQLINKTYEAVVFPKVGYSFSRPSLPGKTAHYNPDAYSHGGISIQELMIPMVVLQVKARVKGSLTLDEISGPESVVEGEEIELRMPLTRTTKGSAGSDELRVEVEASYGRGSEHVSLPRQVTYVSSSGSEVVYRFRPDPSKATPEEHKSGVMECLFTITVSYRDGHKMARNSQTKPFSVKLNVERVVRRVPTSLGNILGLMPKGMR
jgi:hypothetical protein